MADEGRGPYYCRSDAFRAAVEAVLAQDPAADLTTPEMRVHLVQDARRRMGAPPLSPQGAERLRRIVVEHGVAVAEDGDQEEVRPRTR